MIGTAGRSVRRRLVVAGSALVVGSALMVGGALAPAVAAPHAGHAQPLKVTSYDLFGKVHKVTSSTHKKVSYSFNVGADVADKNYSVEPTLSRGNEFHDWTFPVKASSVKIKPAKGSGTVKTHKLMKAYGSFTLKVTSAGKAKKECPSSTGYTTDRPVKITGTPTFNSHSGKHGWGTVDRHKVTLKGTLFVTFGSGNGICGSPHLFCQPVGISVSGFSPSVDLTAESSGKSSVISAFRSVHLSSPHNATREDEVSAKGAALTLTATGSTRSVKVRGASTTITGTATATSTEQPEPPTSCKNTSDQTYFASWKNGAKKLTLHPQIEPPISLRNSADAEIDVVKKTPTT